MIDPAKPLFLDDGTPVVVEDVTGDTISVRLPRGTKPERPGMEHRGLSADIPERDIWYYRLDSGEFSGGHSGIYHAITHQPPSPRFPSPRFDVTKYRRRMVFND